ncbi:unnamed protein product, partial [Staurois parvus]
ASVVRQTGSITNGQVGTGGQAENGRGHKPGIRTGEVSRGLDQAGSATRQEQDAGTRYRAQEKHTPRQSLQVWPSLKYTCISSFRCWLAAGLSL